MEQPTPSAQIIPSVKILSIDGGGIRGIIPGVILAELEERVKQKTNNPQARLVDYFDLIAGTSTGGILTCMLLCPDEKDKNKAKYSAQNAVDLYFERGSKIFKPSFFRKGIFDEKYSAVELEKALKEFLGETKLSDLVRPCLITSYDIQNRRAFFFSKKGATNVHTDFLVRDLARATSAAPTFFEVANTFTLFGTPYPMIDGGVFANNPAMCALVEITKQTHSLALRDIMILSLGTGKRVSASNSYTYSEAKDWGIIGWLRPLIDIMMSANSETTDYQVRKLFENTGFAENYIRFEPELANADNAMDNASPENMKALRQDAGKFITSKNDFLDSVVEKIISKKV